MTGHDSVVRGERVVLPDGVRPASIRIRDGRIVDVVSHTDLPSGIPAFDAGELVVLPGLVDTHVHMNDPGRADWEGVEHATRAAAAGGVTSLVDMPLNSVPATTDVDGLAAKLRAVNGRCYVDVGFWGGVVPGNASALGPLAARGVLGFKCFLTPSGVPEFEHVTEVDLRKALPILADLQKPLLAHAELPEKLLQPDPQGDPRQHSTWLVSRPPVSEHAAIELLIGLARETGARIHIVHLASCDALSILDEARSAGLPITVETCPHYLTFAAEDISDGSTAFKCAPPIREGRHRNGLWEALLQGRIDCVVTDHSPAPPAMKGTADGDFVRAWGGIASLQLGLAAVWTAGRARGLTPGAIARVMSAAPAALAGLGRVKGAIAAGFDADFAIWDPDAENTVDPQRLYHRHALTPYAGMCLTGQVHATFLRGELIWQEGRHHGPPRGRFLLGREAGAKIALR
jgi:allantoinase